MNVLKNIIEEFDGIFKDAQQSSAFDHAFNRCREEVDKTYVGSGESVKQIFKYGYKRYGTIKFYVIQQPVIMISLQMNMSHYGTGLSELDEKYGNLRYDRNRINDYSVKEFSIPSIKSFCPSNPIIFHSYGDIFEIVSFTNQYKLVIKFEPIRSDPDVQIWN